MHYLSLITLLFGVPLALTSFIHPSPPSPLHWDVYLQPPVPVYDPPYNLTFSPTAFTLIHGVHSAILVDAPVTVNSSHALADWIEQTIPGKKLTHVYITHGHGDHFFGIPTLQARFPGLIAITTPHTLLHMRQQISPSSFNSFWHAYFPGDQIPPQTYLDHVQTLPASHKFELEGHALRALEVGQSDTFNTTVLHVPDLHLVVTGDVVYGACHQFLLESNTALLRAEWRRAITAVEALEGVTFVVPSHAQAWDGFGREHLGRTREYIDTWEEELVGASDEAELEDRMRKAYPERVGNFILKVSASGAFGGGLPG